MGVPTPSTPAARGSHTPHCFHCRPRGTWSPHPRTNDGTPQSSNIIRMLWVFLMLASVTLPFGNKPVLWCHAQEEPDVESNSFQPCYVPYSLFPEPQCAEINVEEQCFQDLEKAFDEECALCRVGRGFATMEECLQLTSEQANTTDVPEDVSVPEDISDVRDALFNASDDDTRAGSLAHCSLSLTQQQERLSTRAHPGSNCPFQKRSGNTFLWHDEQAWRERGQDPPQLWSNVELPPNSRVVITSCSVRQYGIFTKIVIPKSSEVRSQYVPDMLVVRRASDYGTVLC